MHSQSFTANSMCMPELEDKNAECIEIKTMNETKSETFANRLLCLAAVPSPVPPFPSGKGNGKNEEET